MRGLAAAAATMDIFHSLSKRRIQSTLCARQLTVAIRLTSRVDDSVVVSVDLLRTTVEGYIKHAHPEQTHSF